MFQVPLTLLVVAGAELGARVTHLMDRLRYLALMGLNCGTRDHQSSLWHVGFSSLIRD